MDTTLPTQPNENNQPELNADTSIMPPVSPMPPEPEFPATPMTNEPNNPWSPPQGSPLPEIPMAPANNDPVLPVLPEEPLPQSDPLSATEYQSSSPKSPLSKNLIYLVLVLVVVGGAGLLILNFSGGKQSVSIEDPEIPVPQSVIEEPVSEADKIAVAENVSKFSGTYETTTEISDSEIPDPDSSEPDMPRRFARTLVLNQDNTATMTSIVDDKNITESGKWAYNLSSNTVKIEFLTTSDGSVSGTRVLAFDAINGDTLVAQSYDKSIYSDTDLVFYKN